MRSSNIFIDVLGVIGPLMVAAAAIWGSWLRAKLAPAKLIIEPHNLRGDPNVFGDPNSGQYSRCMFFHLKVVNKRPWLNVENCRVLLKGMSRRGPDGEFYPIPMSVPLQFVWAPAEITPPVVTIVKEQILDLGFIKENENKFIPRLWGTPYTFQGFIGKDEAVRYHMEIEATNFSSPRYQVFEVAWDGTWEYEPEKMQQHLRIKEIKE
ncbi:MAG: hypothetical protein AB1424_14905 [Thermodesulfobacteriota bacterium]